MNYRKIDQIYKDLINGTFYHRGNKEDLIWDAIESFFRKSFPEID